MCHDNGPCDRSMYNTLPEETGGLYYRTHIHIFEEPSRLPLAKHEWSEHTAVQQVNELS